MSIGIERKGMGGIEKGWRRWRVFVARSGEKNGKIEGTSGLME